MGKGSTARFIRMARLFSPCSGGLLVILLTLIRCLYPLVIAHAAPPQLWRFATGGDIYSSPAIGSSRTLYIGSNDGCLYAINPDGTSVAGGSWPFCTTNLIQSSPSVGRDGTIYVGSMNGFVYAINPNGTQKWAYLTGGPVQSSPAIGVDDTIYVGSNDAKVYAFLTNGSVKAGWPFDAGAGQPIDSAPAIGSDGTIYVRSHSYLYALNPDGTKKWSTVDLKESSFCGPAIGSDGTLYVVSSALTGSLYAVNPSTGSVSTLYQVPLCSFDSSPAVGPDGTLYVGMSYPGAKGRVVAIDPTQPAGSNLKWSYPTGDWVMSSPAIGKDGTVYVGCIDGMVHALTSAGTLKWDSPFPTGDSIYYSSPLIGVDGTVYIGSLDNYLYAISDNSGGPAAAPWSMSRHDVKRTSRYGFEEVIFVSLDSICNGNIPCFDTLPEAVAWSCGISMIRVAQGGTPYYGDILLTSTRDLVLQAGWDTFFISQGGFSTVRGKIEITKGSLTVSNLIIQ